MIHKKIQQLFCKHDWIVVDSCRFSERDKSGSKHECFSCIKKCEKCGKVKDFFERS